MVLTETEIKLKYMPYLKGTMKISDTVLRQYKIDLDNNKSRYKNQVKNG